MNKLTIFFIGLLGVLMAFFVQVVYDEQKLRVQDYYFYEDSNLGLESPVKINRDLETNETKWILLFDFHYRLIYKRDIEAIQNHTGNFQLINGLHSFNATRYDKYEMAYLAQYLIQNYAVVNGYDLKEVLSNLSVKCILRLITWLFTLPDSSNSFGYCESSSLFRHPIRHSLFSMSDLLGVELNIYGLNQVISSWDKMKDDFGIPWYFSDEIQKLPRWFSLFL